MPWEEFIMDVCARFKDDLGGKVVEDFNKLQQTGTVDDYLAKFEELKSLLLLKTPTMPDTHLLDSFIGGLKPAIKPLVKAFKPLTLSQAIEQAQLQEEHVQALKYIPEKPYKFSQHSPHSKPLLPTPAAGYRTSPHSHLKAPQNNPIPSKVPSSDLPKPTRFIPAAERAEKMAKGLCFICDQPYERGHKCSSVGKQLFLVEVLGEEDEEGETTGTKPFAGEMEFEGAEVTPQLSINAMNGSPGYNTMRVNGDLGKKIIHILLDSGSTHNFLDEQLAKKLGYKLELIPTQSVIIAGGQIMPCQYVCKGFT